MFLDFCFSTMGLVGFLIFFFLNIFGNYLTPPKTKQKQTSKKHNKETQTNALLLLLCFSLEALLRLEALEKHMPDSYETFLSTSTSICGFTAT